MDGGKTLLQGAALLKNHSHAHIECVKHIVFGNITHTLNNIENR